MRLDNHTKTFAIGLALAFLAGWCYLPTLSHGFINFDDDIYVYQNAHLQAGLNWHAIHWAFATVTGGSWHPLTWLSLLLDYEVFGLDPEGYHLTNLLLHSANTTLLFLVWRKLSGAIWRSATLATLFALHPLHVESVAWISERKDLLCAFFWCLALLMYTRYVQASRQNPELALWPKRFWSANYWVALFCFGLGLMSKPMIVTFPITLLLLDWWPLNRLGAEPGATETCPPNAFQLVLEKLPFLGATAVFCAIALWAQHREGSLATISRFSFTDRVCNALLSYVGYIGQTFWPARLAVFYPYPAAFSRLAVAGAAALLMLISGQAVRSASTRPYFAFGWMWYLLTLLPVIGLVQVGGQSHADRYTYIPLIGLFTLLIWAAYDLARSWKVQSSVGALITASICAACFVLSRRQISFWHDSESLYHHAIAVTRGNHVAFNNLGAAFLRTGHFDDALASYREAVRLAPRFAVARYGFGNALAAKNQVDEAIAQYRQCITLDPSYAAARLNLGALLGRKGQFQDAILQFEEALKLSPNDAGAHFNLADALSLSGNTDRALAEYLKALSLAPGDAVAHCHLADALARKGRLTEAQSEYLEALRLQPGYAEASQKLEVVLQQNSTPQPVPSIKTP